MNLKRILPLFTILLANGSLCAADTTDTTYTPWQNFFKNSFGQYTCRIQWDENPNWDDLDQQNENLEKITKLEIAWASKVSADNICTLLQKTPITTTLCLNGVSFTQQLWEQIIAKKNLKNLSLIYPKNYDTVINWTDLKQTQLTHLELFGVNNKDHLFTIFNNIPQTLTHLELKDISLNNEDWEHFCQDITDTKLEKVTKLNLWELKALTTNNPEQEELIPAEHFKAIITAFPNIKDLSILYQETYLQHVPLNITDLTINNAPKDLDTPTLAKQLAKKHKNLTCLSIPGKQTYFEKDLAALRTETTQNNPPTPTINKTTNIEQENDDQPAPTPVEPKTNKPVTLLTVNAWGLACGGMLLTYYFLHNNKSNRGQPKNLPTTTPQPPKVDVQKINHTLTAIK